MTPKEILQLLDDGAKLIPTAVNATTELQKIIEILSKEVTEADIIALKNQDDLAKNDEKDAIERAEKREGII